MSRTGVETKPEWRRVPAPVQRRTAALLGAQVVRADRVWGGYAPSATFRLQLDDGRRAFFKATYALAPGSRVHWVQDGEERVYRQIGHLIAPWAPAFYGSFREGDWHAMLLEDVGPSTVPPWTEAKARAALGAYGAFHRATFGTPLPRWLPRRTAWGTIAGDWSSLGHDAAGIAGLSALAGPRAAAAAAWLDRHLPPLRDAAAALSRERPPYALLHLDTRSDNVRVHPGAAVPLRLFDWPFACAGPPELDLAAFAQSVACEGGPAPEQLTRWYGAAQPVRERVLARAVAAVAGFFAARAWQEELPELPRLRSIQRRQLRASLAWAARLLDLPPPEWLDAVPD